MKNELIEIFFVVVVTLLVSHNSIFSLLYLAIIAIEIFKNIKMDEMQKSIRRKSSDFTFYSLLILTIILMINKNIKINGSIYFLYLVFPLILRNILYIGEIINRNKSIKVVGYSLSFILALFIILSNHSIIGLAIELAIPISILSLTLLSIKIPSIGAIGFGIIFGLLTYFIFRNGINQFGKILTYLLLSPSLLFLSYQNLRRFKNEKDFVDG